MSAIGMMDGAFFVGRKEILDWLNSTLELNLSKIEDTASGAVACQLLDIMYPNQIPMHKLNWAAKQDFEFVANYKILQTAFQKLGIEKHVDVDRLISARYMDNLEFMQWFKRFFEMHVHDKGDYDAVGQRSKGKGGAQYFPSGKKVAKSSSVPLATKKSAPVSSKSSNQENTAPNHINHHHAPAAHGRVSKESAAAPITNANASFSQPPPAPVASNPTTTNSNNTAAFTNTLLATELENANKEITNLRNALEESRKSFSDLKLDYEGLEKERDFYFDKLRDIEVLLQELEDKGESNDLTASIFKILYATADGFDNTAAEEPAQAMRTLTVDSNDGGAVEVVTNKDVDDLLSNNNDVQPTTAAQQIALESAVVNASEETY